MIFFLKILGLLFFSFFILHKNYNSSAFANSLSKEQMKALVQEKKTELLLRIFDHPNLSSLLELKGLEQLPNTLPNFPLEQIKIQILSVEKRCLNKLFLPPCKEILKIKQDLNRLNSIWSIVSPSNEMEQRAFFSLFQDILEKHLNSPFLAKECHLKNKKTSHWCYPLFSLVSLSLFVLFDYSLLQELSENISSFLEKKILLETREVLWQRQDLIPILRVFIPRFQGRFQEFSRFSRKIVEYSKIKQDSGKHYPLYYRYYLNSREAYLREQFLVPSVFLQPTFEFLLFDLPILTTSFLSAMVGKSLYCTKGFSPQWRKFINGLYFLQKTKDCSPERALLMAYSGLLFPLRLGALKVGRKLPFLSQMEFSKHLKHLKKTAIPSSLFMAKLPARLVFPFLWSSLKRPPVKVSSNLFTKTLNAFSSLQEKLIYLPFIASLQLASSNTLLSFSQNIQDSATFLKKKLGPSQVQLLINLMPFPHLALRIKKTIYSYNVENLTSKSLSKYLELLQFSQHTSTSFFSKIRNFTGIQESLQVITLNLKKNQIEQMEEFLEKKVGLKYNNHTFDNDCATMIMKLLCQFSHQCFPEQILHSPAAILYYFAMIKRLASQETNNLVDSLDFVILTPSLSHSSPSAFKKITNLSYSAFVNNAELILYSFYKALGPSKENEKYSKGKLDQLHYHSKEDNGQENPFLDLTIQEKRLSLLKNILQKKENFFAFLQKGRLCQKEQTPHCFSKKRLEDIHALNFELEENQKKCLSLEKKISCLKKEKESLEPKLQDILNKSDTYYKGLCKKTLEEECFYGIPTTNSREISSFYKEEIKSFTKSYNRLAKSLQEKIKETKKENDKCFYFLLHFQLEDLSSKHLKIKKIKVPKYCLGSLL